MLFRSPAPLSTLQKNAFQAYINKRKPGGVNVHIISNAPDELRLYITINFNPLVLSDTGEPLLSPGIFPVEDAIQEHIKNLPFNGALDLMRVIDVIELVPGVDSAYITDAQARYGANPFVSFSQQYIADAGYLIIDDTTPLSTTITYA